MKTEQLFRGTRAVTRPLRRLALAAALSSVPLATAGVVHASDIDPATLTPPPPSPYECRATPAGQIRCDFNTVFEVDPFPWGLICDNDGDPFEVWDGGESIKIIASRWYDAAGKLVERTVHETFLGASFLNPEAGTSIRYTQSNTTRDTYAVPGDVNSTTSTTTGNAAIYLDRGQGAIVLDAGRTVWSFDPTIDDLALISANGPQAFIDFFWYGDPSALEPICQALAG